MINPSHKKPIWLIKNEDIAYAFDSAMANIRHRYWQFYSHPDGGRTLKALLALNELSPHHFTAFEPAQVEELLECCFSGSKQREKIISANIPGFPVSNRAGLVAPLTSILKMTFLQLWIDKKVILPLGWNNPIHSDVLLDQLIEDHVESSPMLFKIRALNPNSSLLFEGTMSEKSRELRATGWMRLLVASNLHNADSFTVEIAQDLKKRSFGHKSELARFYTDTFSVLFAESSNDPRMREAVDGILAESREKAREARKLEYETSWQKKVKKRHAEQLEMARGYLEGSEHGTEIFAKVYSNSTVMNQAFRIKDSDNMPSGLALLPDKVLRFCKLINKTYEAFLRSKRLESQKNFRAPLYHLLAYCGPFLTKFFMDRDGNLDAYPATYNDFSCAIYVTADENLLKEVGNFDKDLPETLLKMMNTIMDINQNGPETRYAKIYPIEEFFDYLVAQSAIIPNAEKVRNSFSPECYPKQSRKWGTVKKPLPRMYFSTFISMLYSLEYLAMHLNSMADGEQPGIVAGELKWPNISELTYSPDWTGIWGSGQMSCTELDLKVLNYTPIFYYNGKPRPFRYVPRFYRISEMHINGEMQPRVVMNDVRSTLLMSETGIRQQHLLWLDADRYAQYLDRTMQRPLAPLLVSTDKAHGEWTSIVSARVIEILDRQSAWYSQCTSADFQNKIWYNLNKGSKFGVLRPLFRLETAPKSWHNYDSFRLLLLCLQYFIKTEQGDQRCPDIVWCKQPSGSSGNNKYITDHTIHGLASITARTLISDYTPHGLRAGFVSEAIKFLPPSIVGQWLTGQSEALVSYYSVFDETDLGMTHQQMLCMSLMSNQQKLAAGDFPELAAAISRINQALQRDIEADPVRAISRHKLMSLSNIKRESGTGLDRIIAREVSELAFNTTHICPFNNICPKEVLDLFGEPNCCSACPFAIRGVAHLPAISARKDKYRELMSSTLTLIQQYLNRKESARISSELDQLEAENDRFAKEACLLEAIEMQLIQMYEKGLGDELMVKDRETVQQHYQRVSLPEEGRLLKRLIDVQNFPDASSEDLSMKLAHLRHILLMKEGDFAKLLGVDADTKTPIATRVASQISSMIKSGAISEFDLFAVSSGDTDAIKKLVSPTVPPLQLTSIVT